jgi:hypothetical protein
VKKFPRQVVIKEDYKHRLGGIIPAGSRGEVLDNQNEPGMIWAFFKWDGVSAAQMPVPEDQVTLLDVELEECKAFQENRALYHDYTIPLTDGDFLVMFLDELRIQIDQMEQATLREEKNDRYVLAAKYLDVIARMYEKGVTPSPAEKIFGS